ncbi:YdcF family protein [Gelidibacter salicanalis]|uniref:YdcF family protein n=1 Tax=Gelidibacter salicanalis TaxID=291193 RepID=A0A934KV97_9FLAO|nr:YdcF family protein [Gelidibacter salicanalis]MBJ7880030.1 YdcF family protein [Gelidibacter salicanalis]
MNKEILIILGSPNASSGQLSAISINRLNYCVEHYQKGNRVLCTGGWGVHFNTSTASHASLAKQYLIEKGVLEDDFLDFALSANTVEDAVKIKPIITKFENSNLTIITSDYHLKRVKLIFNTILKAYALNFVGVKSNLEQDAYNALVQHEKHAIDAIIQNGLYF